ncbi:amidohydrolase family protein [Bordetella genomosp. 13]|uniref:amidohydrolase family protein n=1 Tax=Bordetella genomosp. 13 TaxID=463040 RepID=UPI0021B60880|nr:amidohydrolase family protein [Bordetella genomosp. 13]
MPQATDPRPYAAVDTHAHVFERGLPLAPQRRYAPDYDAFLEQYLALLDANGLRHGVLVQPSFLGTDNRYMVRALQAAAGRLRGVAVVDTGFDDARLRELAGAGVVGMRLNLMGLPDPDFADAGWRALLARANALDWHVEVHAPAARLPALLPPLLAQDCRVVVDHFGRPGRLDDLRHLLVHAGTGRVWVKLSAPYRNWPGGQTLDCGREAARVLLAAYGPDRLMWGSDWPHTEHRDRADYASSLAWLDAWLDDPADRRGVLSTTPLTLFQFQGEDA